MSDKLPISAHFYDSIRTILTDARSKAYTRVNHIMIEAYWNVGRPIIEEEQQGKSRAGYGDELIADLSRRLADEFGKGFSVANLRNFRQFHQTFPELGKGYALRSELSWTHYRLIMRAPDPEARAFYMEEAAGQAWSSRQLERNIRTGWHQRLLSGPLKDQKNSGPLAQPPRPEALLKDPYVHEILDLPSDPGLQEKGLETALIGKLQHFLLELGKGFSFVGRQFRISSEPSHFYVDLVFYNYLLECFVLIDLKTEKLTHQDIGQMDMYVRMFDDLKRGTDDNPTLGIILCADKDETVVRYLVFKPDKTDRRHNSERKRPCGCLSYASSRTWWFTATTKADS